MRFKQHFTVWQCCSDPDFCSPEFRRRLCVGRLQRIGRSKLWEFGDCKLPHAANDTIWELFRLVTGTVVFCGPTMICFLSELMQFLFKTTNALRRISSIHFFETAGTLNRSFVSDCSGATVPVVALSITALIGFAGLGTEVANWYSVRRDMQGATDAAAFSAALAKSRPPGTPALITAQAKSVTAQQGFKDGVNGVVVAVNNPPVIGSYSANPFAIEVTMRQPQTPLLSALFIKSSPILTTRSVALLSSSKNCMFVMNSKAPKALDMSSGAYIDMNCGVVVNSSSNQAAAFSGTIKTPNVDIVGNYSGSINSKVTTGVAPVSDPLYYVPPPTWLVGSCDKINYSVSSGAVSISPGVYCGGITIDGSADVTALPGTYILMGGGLNVAGGKLSGNGVTFYNTGNMLYSYAPVQMQNGPVISLAAPTSGSLSGILFFQDRSISSSLPNVVMGSLTGALYFLNSPLTFSTGSSVKDAYTIVVADTVSFQLSNWSVTNDYSSLSNGSPIKQAKIVE